ncbi:hypothetical protein WUBG_01838, partial [Wuchereria bancrofti]
MLSRPLFHQSCYVLFTAELNSLKCCDLSWCCGVCGQSCTLLSKLDQQQEPPPPQQQQQQAAHKRRPYFC